MKTPLYCYTCDMLTGHTTNGIFTARCSRCGNIRPIPWVRWFILIGLALGTFALAGYVLYTIIAQVSLL